MSVALQEGQLLHTVVASRLALNCDDRLTSIQYRLSLPVLSGSVTLDQKRSGQWLTFWNIGTGLTSLTSGDLTVCLQ